ncbi:Alanine dehydrogenase [Salinisphaera sp. LB1]|nr:alanine dehydrogenase [Salinisphaera sp. LB1]AWN14772.1 Alanine dehydrogenase [Salinisphaera sp. LB1]
MMQVGVPKEIKPAEARVGLTPAGARELIGHGHRVFIETGAGAAAGFADDAYTAQGAEILDSAEAVFETADLIVKVKEPQPVEYRRLRENQILFTYLHLAPDAEQTRGLMDAGCIAIAYETVTGVHGGLPLLSPMSEVAGRLSVQAGAAALENVAGGAGVLLGGVPGVPPAKVTVVGGGVVGTNALRMATGLGADVTVLDKSIDRLRELDDAYGNRLTTLYSNTDNLERAITEADLVIGAVLLPGAAAPKLVTREMIAGMRPGSAVVDVAIDQGGCFETSRPTSHAEPTYTVDDVVHYCVTNMPGCVARTSTFALTNATLPYVLQLADKGYKQALTDNPHLAAGLNVHRGVVTHQAVAANLGLDYTPAGDVLTPAG